MALNLFSSLKDTVRFNDSFQAGETTEIVLKCAGKKKNIVLWLSGAFDLNVKSNWKSLFMSGGAIGSAVLDTADKLVQTLTSRTIRQPWLGRRQWEGTEPFKFRLPFTLIAQTDAKKEVYQPAVDLLSLLYPRLSDKKPELASFYYVPGPTVFYSTSNSTDGSGDKGDPVTISLGKFLDFKGCYLDSVSLKFQNAFNNQGWPIHIDGSIEFTVMDIAYVENDGTFMQEGFRDVPMSANQLIQKASDFKEAIEQAVKKVGGGV